MCFATASKQGNKNFLILNNIPLYISGKKSSKNIKH